MTAQPTLAELRAAFGRSRLLSMPIALPFWMVEPSSLPLSGGILAGLMWVPLSWIIQHWVGVFHAVARTVLITPAWVLFPAHRFTLIPALVVLVYLVSIVVLARRPREL